MCTRYVSGMFETVKTKLGSFQNIKSSMPLSEFGNITKSHGNTLSALLICVYIPIEYLLEPYVMYCNIFYVN